jgi:hypothetical protein
MKSLWGCGLPTTAAGAKPRDSFTQNRAGYHGAVRPEKRNLYTKSHFEALCNIQLCVRVPFERHDLERNSLARTTVQNLLLKVRSLPRRRRSRRCSTQDVNRPFTGRFFSAYNRASSFFGVQIADLVVNRPFPTEMVCPFQSISASRILIHSSYP